MSTKRASVEPGYDEQTTEGSDSVYQQQDNVKRAKLISLNDTMLHDLPREMLECILVKAVAMEVKGMKLAKTVWKEKADLVISRLRTVCSQWSSILTTNFFRNELHRALDGIAQETIRLEILHQSPIYFGMIEVAVVRDEMFVLRRDSGQFVLVVFDLSNAMKVTDVIPLPGIVPDCIAGCNFSDCVYVLKRESVCRSILRLDKVGMHQFDISAWVKNVMLPFSTMTTSVNGNLVILSNQERPSSTIVSIYSPSGSLQHAIMLSPDDFSFRHVNSAIQMSDGNILIVVDNNKERSELLAVDENGHIVRKLRKTLRAGSTAAFADCYERLMVHGADNGTILLDREFNDLSFKGPSLPGDQSNVPSSLMYNSHRNELVCVGLVDTTLNTPLVFTVKFTQQ